MEVPAPGSGALLVHDELFLIRSDARIIWCHVLTPQRVSPARGAAAAEAMAAYLIEHVLQRRSPWLGLMLDIRKGPSVFGPVTRAAVQRMFDQAERTRKRVSVLVAASPVQRAQFAELAAGHAPRYCQVTDAERAALDWVVGSVASDG
jgi:NAD(P)-dependent dehydrogenase (short-subunit alcohol dehydrogenase family)